MQKYFTKELAKNAFWLAVAGLGMTYFIQRGHNWSFSILWKVASFTVLLWILLWIGNALLSNALDQKLSWQERPVLRLALGFFAMVAYSLGSVYFLVYFYRWVFKFNVGDDLGGMLYSTLIITTLISMFMTSRSFLINWKEAAVDAERLKKESVEAQYNSLRNQVNPHFLFNSLNALTNLVHQNPDEAVKFIKQLADVYRYVLDTRDKEIVPIQEELKFLESYLFLQHIRFGDKLKLEVSLRETGGYVAPLALQMLVENAIKHNVIAEENPLSIRVYQQDQNLVVENTLQRKTVLAEDSSGLGLENIRKRYEFLSDRKVQIEEAHHQFKVILPIIKAA